MNVIHDPNVQKAIGTIVGLVIAVLIGNRGATGNIISTAKTTIISAEKANLQTGQEKMSFVVNEIMTNMPFWVQFFKSVKPHKVQAIVQKQVNKSKTIADLHNVKQAQKVQVAPAPVDQQPTA